MDSQPNGSKPSSPSEDPKFDLENIFKKLADAPGYILFEAHLVPLGGGSLQLDFTYRKQNMNLDDLKIAFNKIRDSVRDDLLSGTDPN